MVWVQFSISAALMVLAAIFLARYGDVIALRTRLGGMLIGTILLAGATSLPELLTTINSLNQNVPNLAAGNLFGSSMFNIFLLGVLDTVFWRTRVLRRVAMKHALTGALATMLTGMAVFFILTPLGIQIAWVGLDSLLVIAMYVFGLWVIRSSGLTPRAAEPPEIPPKIPSLLHAIIGFALATVVLIVVSPWMVRSSAEIATLTGLGTGFVGALLVAIATSLPEVVTVIAAVRLGAYDLAVGNLFGSNVFNMFALALTDVFYVQGRFLGRIDSDFAVVGMMALLLTTLGVIGNLARLERKLLFVEVDALLLIVGYGLGMWLLYTLGIGV
jgi:cation:H+ antiporter